jgi:HK97 family phage major capsid protein
MFNTMKNPSKDVNGFASFRAALAKKDRQLAAASEFGKLGIDLGTPESWPDDKAGMLALRNKARTAMNTLSNSIDKAKPETITDNIMLAMEHAGTIINFISAELDLQESADLHFSKGRDQDNTLRDKSGQRIGTMLANEDLRDSSKSARALGIHDGGDDERIRLGDFFRGVANMRAPESVRNALSEGTNTAGGYTVPTVLLPGILNALVPASSLLTAGANVAVLETQAQSFNIAATATIPTAAWRSEMGSVAESDAAFRSITITPRSLAFQFKVSRELLQDSPGLDSALRVAIAQAFAKELDRAGLRGTGTAPEIRGLLNTTGVNTLASGTDGAVLASYAKFINAARLIKQANAPAPTAAIMSPREDETVALFTDTTGQPLRRPDALADWQFPITSQIPTNLVVGASADCSEIYVGAFDQFTFFIREGVSVQILKELYAGTGEIGFMCHTRVDVAAVYPAAFTVIEGVRAPA